MNSNSNLLRRLIWCKQDCKLYNIYIHGLYFFGDISHQKSSNELKLVMFLVNVCFHLKEMWQWYNVWLEATSLIFLAHMTLLCVSLSIWTNFLLRIVVTMSDIAIQFFFGLPYCRDWATWFLYMRAEINHSRQQNSKPSTNKATKLCISIVISWLWLSITIRIILMS